MDRRAFLKGLTVLPLLTVAPSLVQATPETVPELSVLDTVNTNFLILQLRKTFTNIAEQYIFEPNDDLTRSSIEHAMSMHMQLLVDRKVIYDYAVTCNRANNPQSVIDKGGIRIDVVFKRTKSDEFLYMPVAISMGAWEQNDTQIFG